MKKLIYYILNYFSHNLEGQIVNLLKKEKKLVIFDVGCFRGSFTKKLIKYGAVILNQYFDDSILSSSASYTSRGII